MGKGKQALEALEATVQLNAVDPDCLVRYYLLRAAAYLDVSRPAQAQEDIMQAYSVIEKSGLEYLRASVQTLASRF